MLGRRVDHGSDDKLRSAMGGVIHGDQKSSKLKYMFSRLTVPAMKTFLFALVAACFTVPVFAGTPEVLLMSGNDQDLLALVRITAVTDETIEATPEFVFPVSAIDPADRIVISRASEYLDADMTYFAYPYNTLEPGHVFFASLNQDSDGYVGKWGLYEVTSAEYREAQFLGIEHDAMAMLQWYMNTGGAVGGKFVGISGETYVQLADGESIEIFPAVENLSLARGVTINRPDSGLQGWAIMFGLAVTAFAVYLGLRLGKRPR